MTQNFSQYSSRTSTSSSSGETRPVYKSEMFVPIKRDSQSFEERQRSLWDDMHSSTMFDDMNRRMEERRRQWEDEVDRMRSDFFKLRPLEDERPNRSVNLLEGRQLGDLFLDDSKDGQKRFAVSFDVSQFAPEEISVRTDEQKLMVEAKHVAKGVGKSVSREFNRTVDIPRYVDPKALLCTLSKDGILQIEAPVAAPEYSKIQQTARPALLQQQPPLSMSGRSGMMMASAPPPFDTSSFGGHSVTSPTDYKPGTMVTEQDGTKVLKMSVEIGSEFGPQDISVRTVDQKLQVTARHEEKSAGRTSVREFSREFDLPADVDPNQVTASVTADGQLLLEAPIVSYQQGSYEGKVESTKSPQVTLQLR